MDRPDEAIEKVKWICGLRIPEEFARINSYITHLESERDQLERTLSITEDEIHNRIQWLENKLAKANQRVRELEGENSNLYSMVSYFDGIPCPKCGSYHARTHVCYDCKFDHTAGKPVGRTPPVEDEQ